MKQSMLRMVSVAKSVENKAIGEHYLEVTLLEDTMFLDGEVLPNPTDVQGSGVDRDQKAFDVKVTTANSIRAKWLPFGTNRVTPPDIRRGERIHVYQFGDADQYYWVCPGMDDHLRKLETVVFAISATQKESDTKLNPDNCYVMEWSSHTKQITLTTSKANGEPFAYTAQFNLADGCFTLADDDSNFWELDSQERRLTFMNKDESVVKLDKKEIFIHSADLVDIETKVLNITCKELNAKADVANIDFKQTNWKGNETRQGNVTHSGNYSQNGVFANSGDITHMGKSIGIGHTHGNGNNGSPTTGVL